MVSRGFDQNTLMDMDHVSLVAMFEELTRQEALDAANDVALTATAAQGTSKGIKETMDTLTRRGGQRPKSDNPVELIK